MENSNPATGHYKIYNILLIESLFKREKSIPFHERENEIKHQLNVTTEYNEESIDNKFEVVLNLEFTGSLEEKEIFTLKAIMIGIFEKIGEHPLPEETFKKINAPAIIYPFMREHISSLCIKAGIGQILLPPVNFKAASAGQTKSIVNKD